MGRNHKHKKGAVVPIFSIFLSVRTGGGGHRMLYFSIGQKF